jgi:glycosyltransferase involved in cell wall biosynthesis
MDSQPTPREPGAGRPLAILLSSYNGARFIAEQIESIRRQTWREWTLRVRDDGSSDETVRIVEALARVDSRIVLHRDHRGNLGPAQSFGVLMQAALDLGAEYVAFADQDDVWQADKVESQLNLIRARESALGANAPLLVHSDLAVVDEKLRPIHPSFLALQGLGRDRDMPLRLLLTQNFVAGCTTLINRALLRVALPLPEVVMHDWWLALCAAALGEIRRSPRATVLYRQHGANTAGSRWWLLASFDAALHPIRWWRSSFAAFAAAVIQACHLARRVERESPGAGSLAAVREYCRAFAAGGTAMGRLRAVRRHRVQPLSVLGYPLFYYARVLLWPGSGPGPSPVDR